MIKYNLIIKVVKNNSITPKDTINLKIFTSVQPPFS